MQALLTPDSTASRGQGSKLCSESHKPGSSPSQTSTQSTGPEADSSQPSRSSHSGRAMNAPSAA